MRAAFKSQAFPVYLWGKTGVGKTRGAAVVFRKMVARTQSPPWPVWVSWPDFCEQLVRCRKGEEVLVRSANGDYYADEVTWWRRWAQRSLLVVDEIGTRMGNEVRLEAMWKLLELRQGLPTIFTGNHDRDGIVSIYDARVLSRMVTGTWIEVDGVDRRVQGFKQRSIKVGAQHG